jgi:thymidylate synthase
MPMNPCDIQYNTIVQRVLDDGEWCEGRNGRTKSVFGHMMRFDLSDNRLPLLTTKRVAWKTCLKELLWFLRGSTSNKELKDENVHIWDANASREFLDSRGLNHLEEDDLGAVYGHQWRHFNAEYKDCNTNYTGKGVDQVAYLVRELSNPETRTSRRIILSAWNPCQLDQMALPPCHLLCQFKVSGDNKDKLSCLLYQRSGDIGLGVPFNIASYAFLTHILAQRCGLVAHELVHVIGDCHIYDDHIEQLTEQVKQESTDCDPKFFIENPRENFDEYTINDFRVEDYKPGSVVKMEMRA